MNVTMEDDLELRQRVAGVLGWTVERRNGTMFADDARLVTSEGPFDYVPNDLIWYYCPAFESSLDACFRYLVPWLTAHDCNVRIQVNAGTPTIRTTDVLIDSDQSPDYSVYERVCEHGEEAQTLCELFLVVLEEAKWT